MDATRGRLLNLLMVVQMAGSFRMGIVAPILALLIRRHGVSILEIGVLGVAGMLGWLIFEPLSGAISDRVNRRVMIGFAIVSTSIIYLLYPFATEFSHFLVLAFALSSFSSASSVPTRALLSASWIPILFVIGALQGALQAGADTSMIMHLMALPSRGKTGVVMGLYAEAENMGGIVANPTFGYAYMTFGPLSSVILISVVLLLTSGISAARLRGPPTPS